jgi:integrase
VQEFSVAEKITALFVKHISRPGKYCDGGNLYLRVRKSTRKTPTSTVTKSWLFRYTRFGKQVWMGLGPYPDISLAEARALATQERKRILHGIDPLKDKRARQTAARTAHDNMLSFAECAELYVESQAPGWSNPKHIEQWRSTLKNLAGPVIGLLPVDQIDTALIMRCVEPIWATKTETASRLRGRIESVLDWAAVRGYRQGENPARWRGHLDKLLPKPSQVAQVKHHPALPYIEIGVFMEQLRKNGGVASRALEFTILTAARTNEVIQAEWSEFDMNRRTWAIPAERMKSKRPHRVPLSDAAVAALRAVDGRSQFVFPGNKRGSYLSNAAMMQVLKRMGRTGITVHGFRSTFRDWCAESTNYPADVAEMALAHVLRDKTEAAYRRGDLLEKRTRLMADWARYCSKPSEPATRPHYGIGPPNQGASDR